MEIGQYEDSAVFRSHFAFLCVLDVLPSKIFDFVPRECVKPILDSFYVPFHLPEAFSIL